MEKKKKGKARQCKVRQGKGRMKQFYKYFPSVLGNRTDVFMSYQVILKLIIIEKDIRENPTKI